MSEVLEGIKWKKFEDMNIFEKAMYQDMQRRKLGDFDTQTEDENFRAKQIEIDADWERNVMYREV